MESTPAADAAGTLVGKLRRRVSPRWVILGGTAAALGVFVYRDRQLCSKARDELLAQARLVAAQPCAPQERVRKVCVYVQPPGPDESVHWAREFFREYVKPIFDAGALDYDIIEARAPGTVARHCTRTLVQKQRYTAWTDQDAMRAAIMTTPLDDVRFNFRMEDYDAYVALGRKPFEELVTGYDAGLAQLHDQRRAATLQAPHAKPSEAAPQRNGWWASLFPWFTSSSATWTPSRAPEVQPLILPTVGFLPMHYATGWRTWPTRIYKWFNKHERVAEMGQLALDIIIQQRLEPLAPNHLNLGLDEFMPNRVAINLGASSPSTEPVLTPEYDEVWPAPPPPKPLTLEPSIASAPAPTANDVLANANIDMSTMLGGGASSASKPFDINPDIPEPELSEKETKEQKAKAEAEKEERETAERKRRAQLWRQYFVPKVLAPQHMFGSVYFYAHASSESFST